MRKLLLLALSITVLSLLSLRPITAQESSTPAPSISPSPTPTTIDYPLPYPGILTDNALYFVKTLRDRVVSFFISDPLKKAQFDLLMSDVRLNAASYLFAKDSSKYSLAETTISKGENYFYNSLQEIQNAKQQGMDVNDFNAKLIIASKKHQEVISSLLQKTSGDVKDRLVNDLKRSKDLEKTAENIKAQK